MSELILPDHLADKAVPPEVAELSDEQKASQLPIPTGYKMLIGLPKIEDKYASGLLKAEAVVRQDEVSSVVAFILEMGPDCYKDTEKFPTGPYCKKGDFVMVRAYSGTRFKLHGVEFRLINDESVEAVIEDPRGYSRAY